MSNEDFQRLSIAEKIAYLNRAVEALKSGQSVTTPNGQYGPYDPERS
jgi:hypothetical protein